MSCFTSGSTQTVYIQVLKDDWDTYCVAIQGLRPSKATFEGQLRHLLFPLFGGCTATILRGISPHIPRFFVHPKKKKEREKMATSHGVDRHFRGPGRQKSWCKSFEGCRPWIETQETLTAIKWQEITHKRRNWKATRDTWEQTFKIKLKNPRNTNWNMTCNLNITASKSFEWHTDLWQGEWCFMPTLHINHLFSCYATHEKRVMRLSVCSLLINTVAASSLAHLAVQPADSADWGLGAFGHCLFLHCYHKTFGPFQAREREGKAGSERCWDWHRNHSGSEAKGPERTLMEGAVERKKRVWPGKKQDTVQEEIWTGSSSCKTLSCTSYCPTRQ